MWHCIWFFLGENWKWLILPAISALAGVLYKLYNMMIPIVWPVRLTTKGKVTAVFPSDVPYKGVDCACATFTIDLKIHPRVDDTVEDFFLELKLKSGQKIKVPPILSSGLECNVLEKSNKLTKGYTIGPFPATFEITQRELGMLGLETAEAAWEFFENSKIWVVLKVRFRNRWPIRKKVSLEDFRKRMWAKRERISLDPLSTTK